ncbi:MAG: hypothetical protein ABIH21_04895 [Patescibacteria group bacterium]
MPEISTLEKSILHTVCWFSVFGYPLTRFEIYKWLWKPDQKYSLVQVHEVIDSSEWLRDKLSVQGGFVTYRYKGPIESLVEDRRKRFVDAVRKYKKLKRVSLWFGLFSSVRAVAAVNTLSYWHTKPTSDIDMYIVVEPGTIWSTRLLLVAPFVIFGKRPGQRSIDPFCFSFFADENSMGTEHLKINNHDPYLAFWTQSVVPIFDRVGVFEKFENENIWASKCLPNSNIRMPHKEFSFFKPVAVVPCCIMKFFNSFSKSFQKNRLPQSIQQLANFDSRVIVRDNMLKFHENDERESYWETFYELTKNCV